ncbi:MAG: hypothetical protein ABIJ27_07750 [Candidatus Omnitrophota bacterium]
MNEGEFWVFLEAMQANRRVSQVSGSVDIDDQVLQATGAYCGGHSVLFEGHDRLPKQAVIDLGKLLVTKAVSLKAKETILMILAHHPSREALSALSLYNKSSDEPLKFIAQLALEECQMWNE